MLEQHGVLGAVAPWLVEKGAESKALPGKYNNQPERLEYKDGAGK